MSSILMRASNSCSPSRLFCMGPKVLPAHCTEPTSWGRCFSCSRRMRFSTPPALDRADTCGEQQRALSSCVYMCAYTHTPALFVYNREWGSGEIRNRNDWKTELYLAFSSQKKSHPSLLGMHPLPGKKVLAVVFLRSVLRLQRRRKQQVLNVKNKTIQRTENLPEIQTNFKL